MALSFLAHELQHAWDFEHLCPADYVNPDPMNTPNVLEQRAVRRYNQAARELNEYNGGNTAPVTNYHNMTVPNSSGSPLDLPKK
ncbi:MAG: hypothetical protein WDO13_11520 [Verrucomicrobiota bacterium]